MLLGFIIEPENANSNYRVTIPMRALADRGHVILRLDDISEDMPLRQLLECDLVHCFRRHDRLADLRELSRRGVAVSFDNDDDISAIDATSGNSSLRRVRTYRRLSAGYTEAAQLADVVTTPSHRLAAKFRDADVKNVTVIGNYLDRATSHFGRASRHQGVVVGWVAGLEHAADLPRLEIVDALSHLLEAHSDVRVLTVGVRLPLRSDRYEHIPNVPHASLIEVTSRIDIGVAPLADTPFNRARSDVKLKEYGAGGAAWLASPVGPYRELTEKQGGLLVDDQAWFETLDRLVRDRRARRRLSRRALRWAKTQTIERHASIWEAEFQQAIARASERMSKGIERQRARGR